MNLKKYLYIMMIVIFMLPIIISCKKNEKKIESEFLSKAISQTKVNIDFQWIVILPGLGCHGCIQEAEAFIREYIGNTEILFVLTKISSLKILQQKTGIKIENQTNIYIDREDNFSLPSNNSIYPCIIHLKDGKIVEYEFQSPGNGAAFRKLEDVVLKQ